MTGFRYFLQEELVRLAEAITVPHKRQYFLDSVANNANLHLKAKDGRTAVKLSDGPDREQVETLGLAAAFALSSVDVGKP
jgi:hypothetical protein